MRKPASCKALAIEESSHGAQVAHHCKRQSHVLKSKMRNFVNSSAEEPRLSPPIRTFILFAFTVLRQNTRFSLSPYGLQTYGVREYESTKRCLEYSPLTASGDTYSAADTSIARTSISCPWSPTWSTLSASATNKALPIRAERTTESISVTYDRDSIRLQEEEKPYVKQPTCLIQDGDSWFLPSRRQEEDSTRIKQCEKMMACSSIDTTTLSICIMTSPYAQERHVKLEGSQLDAIDKKK
ncbi:uncharacterized protein B0J16DRAFT_319187 [Fusarium flagelliforme]|uniref:uncharacterized protein n=1 Tax=Fusarium flagelliforme TaxID=2675880 RepID=UPI001E8E8A83|nr:uncharacterized protein B0J16DRAFT_319187 [Fusarium flagelliforme]KAH7189557.1 hypothetical protein B0J16DRAFT_319187 [Fusarium flagelliforme]